MRVKKLILVMTMNFIVITGIGAGEGDSLYTGNFGVNLFGYETAYLTTGIIYQVEVRDGMDFVGGADFGIHTEKDAGGDVQADFLIPLRIGLHFPFEGKNITFGFGSGLSPCFQNTHDESGAAFLMGPYINGSVRIKVHPVLSIFFQVQQDLLFGQPEWIYSGSRFVMGISF